MADWPQVAVMGGSLGGLTAALVLRDLGCQVDVYERSSTPLQDRGAGIGLHSMTVRHFVENDPLDMERVTLTLPWVRFLNRDGAVSFEEQMNYEFSSWDTIYRALLKNFGTDHYHLDHEVTNFRQDDTGVNLSFANGNTACAGMLVCADGVASSARQRLQPNASARYAGYVAWRGMVHESELSASSFERLADALTYYLTPRGHILVYPIPGPEGELMAGSRLMNMVWYQNYSEGDELHDLMTDKNDEVRTVSLPPGMVRENHVDWMRAFAEMHFPPPIAEVVEKISQPFVQAILDLEVSQMAFGRICLMGDGAFAVRPHAAAGTAKACADAWALRDALRDTVGDVQSALRRWEPGQLALGSQLLERTRSIGDGSQFHQSWVPGDPALRFGLYGPGN